MRVRVAADTVAKKKRNDTSVKIDADLVRDAKIVAAFEDKSLAEYLTVTLRPIIDRALRDHAERISRPKKSPER